MIKLEQDMNKKRIFLYAIGIIIMSLGLSLNVKSYMGMAPILTLPGVLSDILHLNFSNTLFAFYGLFILLQYLLDRNHFRLYDLIQFPVGFLITRMVALFTAIIPSSGESPLAVKGVILILAIIVTGIGVAISVDMKIVPNPADGLASALGEKLGAGLGTGKNIVDLTSVIIALIISLCHDHNLGPIGVGTVAAGLFVGRMIALFNKMYKSRLEKTAGMEKAAEP